MVQGKPGRQRSLSLGLLLFYAIARPAACPIASRRSESTKSRDLRVTAGIFTVIIATTVNGCAMDQRCPQASVLLVLGS
jgi:hypothetical protein